MPFFFLLLFFISIRNKKTRSKALIFLTSFFAIVFFTLSSLGDLFGVGFYFGEANYFKAGKVLTAVVFFYWYLKRTYKNRYDHIRLLWVLFLLATFFIDDLSIPKALIYGINLLLIYFIVTTTIRQRVRSAIDKGLKRTKRD